MKAESSSRSVGRRGFVRGREGDGVSSAAEQVMVRQGAREKVRIDGRGLADIRPLTPRSA